MHSKRFKKGNEQGGVWVCALGELCPLRGLAVGAACKVSSVGPRKSEKHGKATERFAFSELFHIENALAAEISG